MTDKPFCLIDEAAKAIWIAGCKQASPSINEAQALQIWDEHDATRRNYRTFGKAVLDRIVPLIVERCAEVCDEFNPNTYIGPEMVAKKIRALMPGGKE